MAALVAQPHELQVSEEAPLDEPDLSLKSNQLVDEGPGEVKTVTQGDSFYTSGGCRLERSALLLHPLKRQAGRGCVWAGRTSADSHRSQCPVCHCRNLAPAAKTFEELGLSQELLQGLYTEMKFERPSRIQASRPGAHFEQQISHHKL